MFSVFVFVMKNCGCSFRWCCSWVVMVWKEEKLLCVWFGEYFWFNVIMDWVRVIINKRVNNSNVVKNICSEVIWM